MSKKSRKNTRRKNSKKQNKFLAFLVIAAALFIFFYKESPAFKNKVDSLSATLIEKIAPEYKHETAEIIQQEVPQKDAQSKSVIQAEKTHAQTSPKKNQVSKSRYIELPENLERPKSCTKADHELRIFENYSICYRESYEQAEWSAYRLDESQLVKNASRSNDFRPDPKISTGSASLADYKASGYDRGHLSPAADFSYSQNAMSETFYMSNMSPQKGSFNRGIWKDLEAQVRDWAKKFGRVYVVSGPILEKPAESYDSIGQNKVSVPEYYYKVILAPLYEDENDRSSKEDSKSLAAVGFILPNQKCDDSFFNYAVSIDEVEKRTGLDFFEKLEDSVENEAECSVDLTLWE